MILFVLLFLLLLPLALDGDRVVGDLDLDVVLRQPRQVGADEELAVPQADVDARGPLGRD